MRDVLDGRLAALDAEAAAVLTAAAVVGLRVDLALLGAVTTTGPDALLDVVDAAVAGGLLAEDEDLGWVTFPHALVRQALIARTTRNREAHLHQHGPMPWQAGRATAGAVAEHVLAAGRLAPLARRARAALDAAAEAIAVLADSEARRWVDRRLATLDDQPDGEAALRVEALTCSPRATRYARPAARLAQQFPEIALVPTHCPEAYAREVAVALAGAIQLADIGRHLPGRAGAGRICRRPGSPPIRIRARLVSPPSPSSTRRSTKRALARPRSARLASAAHGRQAADDGAILASSTRAGVAREQAMQVALDAERCRDFVPTVGNLTVGPRPAPRAIAACSW